MRKTAFLILLAISFISVQPVQALSWNSQFVVWDGKVYEIKGEEAIESTEIGKYIGKVESVADDYTGEYTGNASNVYSVGTKYYELKNISTDSAIAVEIDDQQWRKAMFIHETPFHYLDLFSKYSPYTLFVLVALLVIIFIKFMPRKRVYH